MALKQLNMSIAPYSKRTEALVVATGPIVLSIGAVIVSLLSSNDLGLTSDACLTWAQVLATLLIAMVLEGRLFSSEDADVQSNLARGAVSVGSVGAIGIASCFACVQLNDFDSFLSSVVVASGFLMIVWLVISPVIAADRDAEVASETGTSLGS